MSQLLSDNLERGTGADSANGVAMPRVSELKIRDFEGCAGLAVLVTCRPSIEARKEQCVRGEKRDMSLDIRPGPLRKFRNSVANLRFRLARANFATEHVKIATLQVERDGNFDSGRVKKQGKRPKWLRLRLYAAEYLTLVHTTQLSA